MGSSNQAPSDIENQNNSLAISMRMELDGLPPLSSVCCIYRVSERLRLVNEKAYTPQLVSIGPLHHGKDSLKAMEEHKKRYLGDYLKRTNESLENYIKIVREREPRLRNCYAETIGFSSAEFVKIILVDSAFIIEVLLRYSIPECHDEHDRIFNRPWMLPDVWPDLRLLENQLPFFILEDLFDPEKITLPSGHTEKLSIIKLSHKFFKSLMHLEGTETNLVNISSFGVSHFVDFLRHLYIPLEPRDGKECKSLIIPSMTELHLAGVKFRVGSSKNSFDIHFNNGILEIPKLTISDETELTFRNLLAFEQCHCKKNYVNDYVVIMDRLANTPKDVDLLIEHGILENRLGDRGEGATLINKLADGDLPKNKTKLADGVIMDSVDFYFADICEKLDVYCRTPWHKWKAFLKKNYFTTPWAIVSVIPAVLLIILTIIQTVCSVLSVKK